MQEPPAIVNPAPPRLVGSSSTLAVPIPKPTAVLMITEDGTRMRGDRKLKDLSHDELLVVIDDLIELIRKR